MRIQMLSFGTRDHPRLCGEKDFIEVFGVSLMGSPPPMRGKEKFSCMKKRWFGITPAYAGKSTCGVMQRACSWDHPRLCGEKSHGSMMLLKWRGSPPPMRGKAQRTFYSVMPVGITPAYAGKSVRWWKESRCWWDHPRLCGEKVLTGTKNDGFMGSPPPMRGKDKKS